MSRRVRRLTSCAVAGVLFGSCLGEVTGPGSRMGGLALAPRFAHLMANALVDVSGVRIVLWQPPALEPIIDTFVVFPAGKDSVVLALRVPLDGPSLQFELTLAMTNAQGDTVFRAGPTTVTASSNPNAPAVATPTLIYIGPGSTAAGVRFVEPPLVLDFGQTAPLVAEAFDDQGAVISGTPIGFELVDLADTLRARIPDKSVGQIVAQSTRGTVAVRAVLLTGPSATQNITIQPVGSTIVVQSGDGQSGVVGQVLAQPIIARVVAADGLGVAGVVVNWEVPTGGGAVDTTNANGDVAALLTLGSLAGPQIARAVVPSLGGASVTFNATAIADVATTLVFGVEPSDVEPGVPMAPSVTVQARDQFGNDATSFTGTVTVATLANPQGAILGGTASRGAVGGVATFDDLTLSGVGTGLTLLATSPGLVPDTSATFGITANTPIKLAFTVQPTDADAASIISPNVVVEIRDEGGNTVTNASAVVSIALLDNPDGLGVLNGVTSVAAVNGVATFSGLSIDRAAVGYSFEATSSGLEPDTSAAFEILVGAPTTLAFSAQPPSATSPGLPFAVAVEALDAGGNLATSFTGNVTVAIGTNPSSGSLSGTSTVAAVSGVAIFPALAIDNLGVGYTLGATSAGLAPALSTPFDVNVPAGVNAWISLAGGSWNTPANWSLGTVPTSGDTVWITQSGTYTVTMDLTTTVGRMVVGGTSGTQTLAISASTITLSDSVLVGARGAVALSGGALVGAGAMTVAGAFNWSGGNLGGGAGSVRVLAGGTLAISSASARTLSTFTLEVAGAGTWTDATVLNSGSAGRIRVLAGGTLDIQGDPVWLFNQGGAAVDLVVEGALTRSTSTGVAFVPGLSVSGTAVVTTGVLEARNAGTSSGTLTAAAGAELRFTNGTQTMTAASLVDGAGTVSLGTSATVTTAGGWAVTGTTLLSAGIFNFNGTGTTGVFDLVGGTKAGSGLFGVTGAMTWSGGSLAGGSGTTRVEPGATALISTAVARTLSTHTLEIAGTGTWTDATVLNSGSAGRIRVAAGGTLDIQGDPVWFHNQGGTQSDLVVEGALTRSTSTGVAFVPGLSVSGTAVVTTGVLEARNAGTSSGTLTAAAGAELRFTNGTQTMTAASLVDGAGTVSLGTSATVTTAGGWAVTGTTLLSAGTFNFNGTGTTGVFDLVGGTKAGSGLFGVTGAMTWSSGNIAGGSGTTRVEPGATALISTAVARTLSTHTLEIAGTGTWTDATVLNSGSAGRIRVAAGGTLDIQGDPVWFHNQGGTQSDLVVEGALTRSTSTGVAFVPGLSVSGTVVVTTGVLEARNAGTSSGTLTAAAGAELRFTNGTQTMTAASLVDGAGTVSIGSSGIVTTAGGWAVTGTTLLTAGTFNFNGTGSTGILDVAGGTRAGSGTLDVIGTMSWTTGSLSGGGGLTRVLAGSALTISGTTTRSLNAQTLEISGTATWTGVHLISSGSLGVLRVMGSGSLEIQGDPTLNFNEGGGTSRFENLGAISRTTSVGSVSLPIQFVNSGTVVVSTGTVDLLSGGTLGGSVDVSASAVVRFGGGTHTLQPGFTVTGSGLALLDGATLSGLSAADTVSFTNLRAQTGALNPGAGSVVRVDTIFDWAGVASLGGGGTTHIAPTAIALLSGTATRLLNAHTLAIEGISSWSGAFQMNSGGNARIHVLPAGALVIQHPDATTASFLFNQGGGASVLQVDGVLQLTSTGTFMVSSQLQQTGSTALTSGLLRLGGGGSLGGTVIVISPAAFEVFGGTLSLAPSVDISGPGQMFLTAGTLTNAAAVDTAYIERLRLDAGTLDPTGTIVVSSRLEWAGTTALNGGLIVANDTLEITGSATRQLSGATLESNGTGVATSTFQMNSGNLGRIRNTGTFDWSGDGTFLFNQGGGASVFENQGTLTRSTSTGTATISAQLVNTGLVSVTSGVLNVTGGGSLGGSIAITDPAVLQFGGGVFTLQNAVNATGTGFAVIAGGTLSGLTTGDTARFANLRAQTGTLSPAIGGVVQVNDAFEWTGTATLSGGGTTYAGPSSTVAISGGAARQLRSGHVLRLEGNTAFTATGSISSGESSVISNTGTFDWQGSGSMLYSFGGGTTLFRNVGEGSLTSSGATTGSLTMAIENTGLLAVTGDTLRLAGGSVVDFRGTTSIETSALKLVSGTFTMTGNLSGGGASGDVVVGGTLNLNGNSATVVGDFLTVGSGVLVSASAPSSLLVSGNALFSGATSTLSNGSLTVGGNFAQSGATTAFSATGTHLVVLDGAGAQSVTFANPGTNASTSHFGQLRIGNSSVAGIQLQSPVFVVNQLLTSMGRPTASLVGSSTGDSLWIAGIVADSIVFDNVPLRLAGTSSIGAVNSLTFQNMDPAVNQWVITRAGQTFVADSITFSTPPNAGVNNLVINNTTAAPFPVTFTNSSPPGVTMTGPPARYSLSGPTLPVLTWNSVQLP